MTQLRSLEASQLHGHEAWRLFLSGVSFRAIALLPGQGIIGVRAAVHHK
jgi:hypothetical protein